jgi:hypothetical protein
VELTEAEKLFLWDGDTLGEDGEEAGDGMDAAVHQVGLKVLDDVGKMTQVREWMLSRV